MREFNYNPTITGNVIKTKEEQFDKFFYQGHPVFLIPDFNQYPEDIWLSYMNFLEKEHSCDEIYDQDGGEVHSIEIINENTGLTKCIYTAYGIIVDESDEPQDVDVEIEGYIMECEIEKIPDYYIFVATKVLDNYKISI